jgi:hypothetical protein
MQGRGLKKKKVKSKGLLNKKHSRQGSRIEWVLLRMLERVSVIGRKGE